jgi:sortase A
LRLVTYFIGTVLFVVGLAVLLGVGGVYAYSYFERARVERELAETPIAMWTPAPTPTDAPEPTATLAPTAVPSPGVTVTIARPTATRTPAPTATPVPQPPQRIVAPSIKLDSRVVESPIHNGVWEVPKFVAGHLELTANPGEIGNIVLAGHVESISSGNVFASLGDFEVGDGITLQSAAGDFRYTVVEKRIVRNDDVAVVAPTPVETLTLITCYGIFLPAAHD